MKSENLAIIGRPKIGTPNRMNLIRDANLSKP